MRISATIFVATMAALACAESPTDTDEFTGESETYVVAVGQTAAHPGLTLALVGVPEDSRCPTQVTCFWEGNGQITVQAEAGGTRQLLTLNTNAASGAASANVEGFEVSLVMLDPHPVTEEPIPVSQYRATLEVRTR